MPIQPVNSLFSVFHGISKRRSHQGSCLKIRFMSILETFNEQCWLQVHSTWAAQFRFYGTWLTVLFTHKTYRYQGVISYYWDDITHHPFNHFWNQCHIELLHFNGLEGTLHTKNLSQIIWMKIIWTVLRVSTRNFSVNPVPKSDKMTRIWGQSFLVKPKVSAPLHICGMNCSVFYAKFHLGKYYWSIFHLGWK